MEFDHSEEQLAIRDSLDRWLTKNYTFDARRKLLASETGASAEAWSTYAEMGLLALPIAEAHGGLGGNGVDVALVMEAFGKALVLEPYLSTVVLGAGLIEAAGYEAQRASLLPAVAEGRLKLAVALQEPASRYARHRVATRAIRSGAGWKLSGHKAVVVGAPLADSLIVSARTSGAVDDPRGISLFVVDANAPGLRIAAYRDHDGQRAAEVVLDDVTVASDAALGDIDAAMPALDLAIDRAIAAICAEAVGILAALNETTLAYLKTRKQFGVTIGSFQALQHRMADMVVAAEQARSMATLAAVRSTGADAAERGRVVSAAKAYIGRQARLVGQEAVQMHGGMGLVDELIVSHYFKRLTLIETSFGDSDHHLDRFSRTLLDPEKFADEPTAVTAAVP